MIGIVPNIGHLLCHYLAAQYSFMLDPGKKRRYIAGSYNAATHKPKYEIEVYVPSHVKNQIEIKQILVGTPESCQWGWDIHNKSTWSAFVTIKKDGLRIV